MTILTFGFRGILTPEAGNPSHVALDVRLDVKAYAWGLRLAFSLSSQVHRGLVLRSVIVLDRS